MDFPRIGHPSNKMPTRGVVAFMAWWAALGFVTSGCDVQSPVVGNDEPTGGRIEFAGSFSFVRRMMTFDENSNELVGTCLPRPPATASDGSLMCKVVSARWLGPTGECRCDGPRRPIVAEVRLGTERHLETYALCGKDAGGVECSDYCLCEELELTGSGAEHCVGDPEPSATDFGWCYVDPERGVGDPKLVDECPDSQQRMIRFLPDDVLNAQGVSLIFVSCSGGSLTERVADQGSGAFGTPCLPGIEAQSSFNGFHLNEIGLELGSTGCRSNICLVNHLQGRVSCPYGQRGVGGAECLLPGSDAHVEAVVDPQLVARQARDLATCSCQCDGSGPGPFCECPNGYSCEPLVDAIGVPGEDAFVGSYCVDSGTVYDPIHPPYPDLCDPSLMNCGDLHPF
jgi:hypothetical protein